MNLVDEMNEGFESSQLGNPDDYIQSPNTMPYFVDGDTVDKGGVRYRLVGFDTPEVTKILDDGTLKMGTPGGGKATGIMSKLANDNGFTNIRPLTDDEGNIRRDKYDRILAELVDSNGNSFKDKILREGILGTSKYSSDLEKSQYEIGAIERFYGTSKDKPSNYDKARNDMLNARLDEGAFSKGVKRIAFDEEELAAANQLELGNYYSQNLTRTRKNDRTITNESLNPISDSWEQGWMGVMEGMYGFLELSGDGLNVEKLSDVGEEGVERYRAKVNEYGTRLVDYRDIDGAYDTMIWMANNAAMSVPYMAMALGTLAVANVATPLIGTTLAIPLGISAPSAVYAGQTYNEMVGDRDPKIAMMSGIVQASLDRLGIAAIFSKGLMPKQLLTNAVAALEAKGVPKMLAQAQVATATKRELASFAGDAAKIAKQQIRGKELFKSIAYKSSAAAGGEGFTELGQEATNYIAATYGSDLEFDFNELNRRLITSAITGGALGLGFSAPFQVSNHVGWANVVYGATESDGSEISDAAKFADDYIKSNNLTNMPSNKDNSTEADKKAQESAKTLLDRTWDIYEVQRERSIAKGEWSKISEERKNNLWEKSKAAAKERLKIEFPDKIFDELDDRSQRHMNRWGNKSFQNRVIESLKMFPKLVHSISTSIFTQDRKIAGGPPVRMLADILGNANQKSFTGPAWESEKVHLISKFLSLVMPDSEFYTPLVKGRMTPKNISKVSKKLYEVWMKATKEETQSDGTVITTFDPSLIPKDLEGRDTYIKLIGQLNESSDLVFEAVNNMNDEINAQDKTSHDRGKVGYLPQYLSKYRSPSAAAIRKKKKLFKKLLLAIDDPKYKVSESTADAMIDKITNGQAVDLDEAFSMTKGDLNPSFTKERTLKLSERPEFEEFLEQDIFVNIDRYTTTAARHLSHSQFIGKDGRIVNQLLNEAEDNMASVHGREKAQIEIDKMAFELSNAILAESGNFKRATSAAGKRLEQVQRSFLMFTALAGLSLSTISSFVELALTGRHLRPEDVNGLLKTQANELAGMLKTGMKQISTDIPAGKNFDTAAKLHRGQRLIRKIGFVQRSLGASTTVGATEINAWQRNIMQSYFKWNGLQGWTNYTRAVRAAIAADFISEKLKLIADYGYVFDADLEFDLGTEKGRALSRARIDAEQGELFGEVSSTKAALTKKEVDKVTREVTQARESLRNLGLDVETFVDFYKRFDLNIQHSNREEYKVLLNEKSTAEQMEAARRKIIQTNNEVGDLDTEGGGVLTNDEIKFRNDQLREATFNFVNEAVALPMAMNRPLIYQDPRYALFTQFQGFMSTFTASHLPRLYGEYLKRGSPTMKYSAYSMMATMIMLGFASQFLKDMLKYEDEDNFLGVATSNPYLDTSDYIQRGVRSSGLLGTYERLLDQFAPLYPQGKNSDSWIEFMFGTVARESPGLSNLERIFGSGEDILTGDVGSGIKKLSKATPFIGSINRLTNEIGDLTTNLNFKE